MPRTVMKGTRTTVLLGAQRCFYITNTCRRGWSLPMSKRELPTSTKDAFESITAFS
jgi:hypothetical protein